MSAFDKIYRSALPMKFFTKGWGKPETLLRLIENMKLVTNRDKFLRSCNEHCQINIEKRSEHKRAVLLEGSFHSPFDSTLPDILVNENKTARFQMIMPKEWHSEFRPLCIQFAGTGDHTYSRRRLFLANQLIDDGIASIIIMNPFYWKRKPPDQRGSSLNYVSDLFIMGGALILECYVLLKWCEKNGYNPLALHGISMGGYGILSNAVDWSTLTKQYYSDSVFSDVIKPKLQPAVPVQFRCTDPNPNDLVVDSHSTQSVSSVDGAQLSHTMSVPQPELQCQPSNLDNENNAKWTQDDKLGSSQQQQQALQLLRMFTIPNPLNFSPSSLTNTISSWNLSAALRYPLDASLWHSGMSFIRSIPDNLTTASSSADPEVREFLRDLLDYFTHLGNFSPTYDSRLVLTVEAEDDAYVPRRGICPMSAIYPGSELRTLPRSGHVGAYLRNTIWTQDFRQAITDCMNRHIELHHHQPGPFGASRNSNSSLRGFKRK